MILDVKIYTMISYNQRNSKVSWADSDRLIIYIKHSVWLLGAFLMCKGKNECIENNLLS